MTSGPTAEPDPSDDNDYGYDLAHEVKDALQIPVKRRRPSSTVMGTGRPVDPDDDDLGYAEAHDMPGS
jgi:hypothetical protein